MKVTKLILCFVAMATMLFAGCTKDDNGGTNNGGGNNNGNGGSNTSALVGTTWQLNSPNDQTYHGDVIYTVSFGQGNEVTFTRDMDFGTSTSSAVMEGTYTYNEGNGVAMIHNVGETTDYRITFTVSGNTLTWNFSLREIVLQKV